MESNTYTFQETQAKVDDIGSGKVVLTFSDFVASTKQNVDEAKWAGDVIERIHNHYDKCDIELLVFLSDPSVIQLDARLRSAYKEILERSYMHKVAMVGDQDAMAFVLTITVLVLNGQDRIKFFSSDGDARRWLGWERE